MAQPSQADLVALLDEEHAAIERVRPLYAPLAVEMKLRSASAADTAHALSAGASLGPAGGDAAPRAAGAGGGLGLQTMLSQAMNLAASGKAAAPTARSTPELAGDPLLFKTALTKAGEEWDSVKSTGSGRADIFLRMLPRFSMDATRGCNAVVLRAQMTSLAGLDKEFAAINIGRAASESAAAATLSRELLTHVYWRVDPIKMGAEGVFKYRFNQTYKQGGRYATDVQAGKEKMLMASQWPFKADRPFFVRIMLDPRGSFAYVDGRFFKFTPFPGGQAPDDGETLFLQLPLAGDAGEKPTWRVLSAHWGSCRADAEGERAFGEFLASPAGAAAFSAQRIESEEELYVTGVPQGATEAHVLEEFRLHGGVAATLDRARPGAATVRLGPPAGRPHISAIVAATDRKVAVAGTVLGVRRALVQARPGVGAGAGGGGRPLAAPAPAGASMRSSGMSPSADAPAPAFNPTSPTFS
jgi:hypothetical protein